MADYDPNLIVRLVPLNERTRNAWKNPHNAPFYVPGSYQGSEDREDSSRGTTPFYDELDSRDKVSDSEAEIRLKLDSIPKDVTQGFVFGNNKKACDIYCGERSKGFNISGMTFSITINKRGQVVLKYLTPKSRISVQYGDQDPGVRTSSTWILFEECRKGIIIEVAEKLRFQAILPDHSSFGPDYRDACYDYVTDVESAVASIPTLTMDSQPPTTDLSSMPTPNSKPFYYRYVESELGRGSSGKVYLVHEVNSGKCLHALMYLHAKPTVIHRDIKPENILVDHRYPAPKVKIGDFGIAKEGSKAEGISGTWTYTAPEAFSGGLYDPTVDIWSLGVVVMQMLLKGRLPKPKDGVPYGATWCKNIESFAAQNYIASEQRDRRSLPPLTCSMETALWSFIMSCMLKVDAEKRFSAKKCFEVGKWTLFEFITTSKGEGERTPTGRQDDYEGVATKRNQPINPIAAPPDVMSPKMYDSVASGVAYDRGVVEAEVWKGQGSKGDATPKPAVKGGSDGSDSDEPTCLDPKVWKSLEREFATKKANGKANGGSSSVSRQSMAANNPPQPAVLPNASTSAANNAQQPAVLPNASTSAANNAPSQTLDWAAVQPYKKNYEEALMAHLRS
ncbi:MAG: hypothetical protein ASARMPREDX12_000056 [Alectoria sarmentosa]|nr:MAG: hypothetical protein ASARMPREDX12_000056 [Alectoria sarmentosa]